MMQYSTIPNILGQSISSVVNLNLLFIQNIFADIVILNKDESYLTRAMSPDTLRNSLFFFDLIRMYLQIKFLRLSF